MMRAWRIGSVFAPSLIAVLLAVRAHATDIHIAGHVLAGLWIAMAIVLLVRYRQAPLGQQLAQLDILSATGRATAWTALAAIVLAITTGWASLSVLGILGLGVVCLATTWTALMAGGDRPWRTASIKREVLPDHAIEGEPLREEIALSGVRIPAALRLFATGRPTRHGVTTRYAIGSASNDATIKLASELGPAPRGEHIAPALALWLGDVLGLTRTAPLWRGECQFTVAPRISKIENARELLGDGRDDMKSRDTIRMPTEGTFRIREYQPGDDTRRIHWVRSLQANKLVVRLPDEIPPADPVVRIVLDNHLADTHRFTCRAPDELLDVMVRVWLGVGKALAESGTRVTLVTALEKGGAFRRVERPMHTRASHEAVKLGARVAWQPNVRLDMLLDKTIERQIVVSCRPRAADKADGVAWVIVPHNDWTSPERRDFPSSAARLTYAVGSAENRLLRRRAERARQHATWDARRLFSQLTSFDWKAFSGGYVARPAHTTWVDGTLENDGRIALQVIP